MNLQIFGIPTQIDLGNVAVATTTLVAIWFAFRQNSAALLQDRRLETARLDFEKQESYHRLTREFDQVIIREVSSLITDAKVKERREDVIRRIDYLHLLLNPKDKHESGLRDGIQMFANSLDESGSERFNATSEMTNALRALIETRDYSQKGK